MKLTNYLCTPALLLLIQSFFLGGCGNNPTLTPILEAPLADKSYYQKLLTQVESQIRQSPENVELRIKMADYHQSMAWPQDSEDNMLTLIKLAPKEPQVMMLAADYYINKGDFEQSWIYAQQANRLGSVHPSLSLIQAKYLLSRRNFKDASRLIEYYFTQGGSLPEAFAVGAELANQAGDTARARQILESGVQLNPGNFKLHSTLSEVYVAAGQPEKLADLIKNYQGKTNDRAAFRNELLGAYVSSRDFAAASRLAKNWPVSSESGELKYGNIFLESIMADSANYYADQILATDSTNTGAMLLKARYLSKRGRLNESYKYYSLILDQHPGDQIAMQEIGIVRGKIAYLRKIREEKAAIPVFDFAPKKSNN